MPEIQVLLTAKDERPEDATDEIHVVVTYKPSEVS